MLMNIPRKRINIDNESGFASLVVASVLIVVLSLMTVGFAQLMRSNQTSALNKQLSDQAYYAAESGINDAAQAYNAGYSLSKTACGANTDTSISDSTGVDTNLPGYQYIVNPSINTDN
jgi:Tfp pilus assembly protein PilX